MGSETPSLIPKIDLTQDGLVPGSAVWESVRTQVMDALGTIGCFEALFNGVDPEVRQNIFNKAKEVFELPTEVKFRAFSPHLYDGYFGLKPALSYESTSIKNPQKAEGATAFTELMWPEGNPSFSEAVQLFSEQASGLDKLVRRMVIESLGLKEHHYESLMGMCHYFLRLSEYGIPPPGESTEMIAPHTDWSATTIIDQNGVSGLEVIAKDGESVLYKPSGPNSLIYLAGDALQAWTNGRGIRSCRHRVVVSGGTETGEKTRYTALLGSAPNYDVEVKAPEELVDEANPRRFRAYYYPDYMKFAGSEAGKKAQAEKRLVTACVGVEDGQVGVVA